MPAADSGLDRLARRFTPWRVIGVLVALGAAWRIGRYALAFPFWGDESFVAINFITRDFAGMIRPLDWGQIVPLGVMWAELAISRLAGLSEWSLRWLPTVAGLASLALFVVLARRLLPGRASVIAIGIFAASYYVVRHGAEVKPYATDCLVSLALTLLALRVWDAPRSGAAWCGLTVAGGLAIWCSYPAAFVGGSIGLWLAWRWLRDRPARVPLPGLLAYGFVFLASFAAMYVIYARPHAQAASRLTEIEMWTQPLEFLLWLLGIHTGLLLAYPLGGTAPGSLATLVLVVLGAAVLWRTRQRALLWLLLGPLTLTFVAASMKAYPYGGSARTSLYMAPAFCLLAGLGAWLLLLRVRAGPLRRHLYNTILIGLAVIPLAGLISDIRKPYSSEDTRLVRAKMREYAGQFRPGDLWITFNAAEPRDYAPWLGDWRGTGGQFVFEIARLAPGPLEWAPLPEQVRPPGEGGRVWLFAYRGVRIEFPQAQFDAYRARLEAVFGPPAWSEQTLLKQREERIEAIDVLRFDGGRSRPAPGPAG